jgi:hypothetical protein
MEPATRRSRTRVDEDGVKTVETPGVRGAVWLLAAAILAVGAAFFGGLRFLASESAERPRQPAPAAHAREEGGQRVSRTANRPQRKLVARSAPRRAAPGASAAQAGAAASRPAPGSSDAAAAPAAEDEPTGIALFPPPGTDPPKSGIIVPEDFALPEGFVRHHQVTDDGKPLPPILMFHPDYEFVDENGAPLEIPADHVVPPELAPPGLPVQILEVPDTAVPMIEPEGESSR